MNDQFFSSIRGPVAIFSTAAAADAALGRLFSCRGAKTRPSIVTRRSTLRNFIARRAASLTRQKTSIKGLSIRGGHLNGVLGLTAGVGAIESPELGPIIATGSFRRSWGQNGRGLLNKLKNLGLSDGDVDQIVNTLGDEGVLVACLNQAGDNAEK